MRAVAVEKREQEALKSLLEIRTGRSKKALYWASKIREDLCKEREEMVTPGKGKQI